MKTKLEQINTAAELITFTLAFGVPTDPESICRMQDIIGNSTTGELEALAEKYKEHDRNGKQFYFVLYHIWSWEDATRFFMQHSSLTVQNLRDENGALSDQVADQEKEIKDLTAQHTNDTNRIEDLKEKFEKAAQAAIAQEQKAASLTAELANKDREIIELKAKLYDLITKQ